jgi:hypothetical protein
MPVLATSKNFLMHSPLSIVYYEFSGGTGIPGTLSKAFNGDEFSDRTDCQPISSIRLFWDLRPMPDCNDPDSFPVNAIEESVRCYDHLPIW